MCYKSKSKSYLSAVFLVNRINLDIHWLHCLCRCLRVIEKYEDHQLKSNGLPNTYMTVSVHLKSSVSSEFPIKPLMVVDFGFENKVNRIIFGMEVKT